MNLFISYFLWPFYLFHSPSASDIEALQNTSTPIFLVSSLWAIQCNAPNITPNQFLPEFNVHEIWYDENDSQRNLRVFFFSFQCIPQSMRPSTLQPLVKSSMLFTVVHCGFASNKDNVLLQVFKWVCLLEFIGCNLNQSYKFALV